MLIYIYNQLDERNLKIFRCRYEFLYEFRNT